MSNALQQLQAQEQGPSESQNFAQPSSSSNTTLGEFFDDDCALSRHSSTAQNNGPSTRQIGHFCRLPNGHMEWVPNPNVPQGGLQYYADIEIPTLLPDAFTTIHAHSANNESAGSTSSSSSSRRRSMMANMFRNRIQNTLCDDDNNWTPSPGEWNNVEEEAAPWICSDEYDPAQLQENSFSPSLPDYFMEEFYNNMASSTADPQQQWNNDNSQMVLVPMVPAPAPAPEPAPAGISSALRPISSNPRLVVVQQQKCPIPLYQPYREGRSYRVSKNNTSEPSRRQQKPPRSTIAVLPKMGKVLEELEDNNNNNEDEENEA